MNLKLIHVHGFGEVESETDFTERYKKHLPVLLTNVAIEELKWNTLSPDLTVLVHNFRESEARTHNVASVLAQKIMSCQNPVFLSGFSLGAAVVVRALNLMRNLDQVAGVVLFGAAIDQNSRLPKLPSRGLYLNFYSRKNDNTLRHVFYNAMGSVAAGTEGFKNASQFINCQTSCRHFNAIKIGDFTYARLVPVVCGLIGWHFGVMENGSAKSTKNSILIGKTSDWDDIYEYKKCIIQRHSITGMVRAIEGGGIHREVCASKYVSPVLKYLKDMPS